MSLRHLIFSVGIFCGGGWGRWNYARRLKKPVRIFVSIFEFFLRMVFGIVKAVLLSIIPFREKQRTKQLYGTLKIFNLAHGKAWLYELFSRWRIDLWSAA